jgi:hypothetical protein
MNEPDHIRAHAHCTANRQEILRSIDCGCFFCGAIFPPGDVYHWTPEYGGGESAWCPECGMDSVIGSASGYPISTEFLQRMHDYWFSPGPMPNSID